MWLGGVALALLGSALLPAAAQEERPQIYPGERKPARKKDTGPRAIGVLQLAANGKASLVPIAILINGKFWDASAYKADPVPFSLDSGTVYEAERSGSSLGLFTVGSALHSNSPNVPNPWIGTGTWRPTGSEPSIKIMKAESAPVGIDTTDEPPRLSHNPTPANTAPASAPPPPSQAPQSGGTSGSGDEPPRLSKPASTPSSAPPAESKPSTGSSSAAKPEDKTDEQSKIPASDSGANEANRPVLRRGKPAESFADEDIPGYSKPGAAAPASGKVAEAASAPGNMQLIPAISDASGPAPRSFAFDWLKDEEADRRKQIEAMARDQVRTYVAARAKVRISPTATPTHPAAAHRAVKLQDPILDNQQMITYDLWNSNQPIIIFSAKAHMPPPPAGTAHSETETDVEYSVMLVAYPDIYNNLHKLYSGVTDRFHLDVTPRLELIDAVDADGDGRGELLFKETSDIGTGWIIYRVTADKLWKMFDSLYPE